MQREIDSIVGGDKEINEKYLINSKIGEGCFGTVYDAINRTTFRRSALKLQPLEPHLHNQTLNKEFMILMDLANVEGIPKCYSILKTERHMLIEIQLLQKDMHTILKDRKGLSETEVCRVGAKILRVLKEVHARKIVHRDLKPQNIMTDAKGHYFLVDFGIATTLREDNKNRKKLRKVSNNDSLFVGTPRYASVGAHCNEPQTPLDDIESLLYVLVFMATKSLPWMNLRISNKKKIYQIGYLKQKTPRVELCNGLPDCFLMAFAYLDRLNSYKQLNHDILIEMFDKHKSQPKPISSEHIKYIAQGRQFNSDNLRTKKKRCSIDQSLNRLSVPRPSHLSQGSDRSTTKMSEKLVLNRALGFTTFAQPENFAGIEEINDQQMKLEDKIRELTEFNNNPYPRLKRQVDRRAKTITF